jgi:hypothetical protein
MGVSESTSSFSVATSQNKNIPELRVTAQTWTRESHGLYDFEGSEVNVSTFGLKGTHTITRTDSVISVQQLQDQ